MSRQEMRTCIIHVQYFRENSCFNRIATTWTIQYLLKYTEENRIFKFVSSSMLHHTYLRLQTNQQDLVFMNRKFVNQFAQRPFTQWVVSHLKSCYTFIQSRKRLCEVCNVDFSSILHTLVPHSISYLYEDVADENDRNGRKE